MAAQRLLVFLMIGGFGLAGYGAWLYHDVNQFSEADIKTSVELNTMVDASQARNSDDPLWRNESWEDRRARIDRELRASLATERKEYMATIFSGLVLIVMAFISLWFGPGRKSKPKN